jgi:hypothetical protein
VIAALGHGARWAKARGEAAACARDWADEQLSSACGWAEMAIKIVKRWFSVFSLFFQKQSNHF